MLRCKAVIAALLLLFLCHLPFLLPSPALAQGGIILSPARILATVSRGETIEKTINIENQGDTSVRIHSYVMDFSADSESSFNVFEPGHESYSCARWLSFEDPYFDLSPGESRIVDVTISVPVDVEPGGHYAALFFETTSPEEPEGTSVSTICRIASLFYLTIPGITDADIVTDAEITSLLLPGWVEKGPVDVGVVVRNTGNVHLDIAAKAYFSYFGGRKVSELDLGQITVLPHSERTIKATWDETPFIGKVKARIVIGYLDQNGEVVNKTATGGFWINQWKIMSMILVIICVLGLLIWRLQLYKKYHFSIKRR